MVFKDTTTKLGLIEDCEMNLFGNYGDISGNADRLYDVTARINRRYDLAATIIMASDAQWQWDDTNYTDLPIGSTNLVLGQQDYTMSVEHLSILKVVIKDAAGNKREILPYSIHDNVGTLEAQTPTTVTGVPTFYRKTGVTFMLYAIPNYNSTGGLIVYYQRKPSYFDYTDTTKSPGIPSIFHRYLSLGASLDYAISHQLTQKNDLAVQVKEMEDYMADFYSKRAKDEGKFIKRIFRSSR